MFILSVVVQKTLEHDLVNKLTKLINLICKGDYCFNCKEFFDNVFIDL